MKKLFFLLILVAAYGFMETNAGAQCGEIRRPGTVVNIRAERNAASSGVGKLYPGNRVRVDFYGNGWYAVFGMGTPRRDESAALGYVAARFLKPVDDTSNIANPDDRCTAGNLAANASGNFCGPDVFRDIDALKELVHKHSKVSTPQTGDLPKMIANKTVRVLTPYSKTHYYVSNGVNRGFEYSLLEEYERHLNGPGGRKDIGIVVEFIPLPEIRIVQALLDGIGDIAVIGAAALPSEYSTEIAFTEPYIEGIGEVVVANDGSNRIKSFRDLAGKRFYLHPSEGHFRALGRLNALLLGENLPPALVVKAEPFLGAEDILELIDAGIVETSILESHVAALWTPVFPNVSIFDQIPFSDSDSVSFAVRKGNPKLKASLDGFIEQNKTGTLLGNILFDRYFSDASRLKNPLGDEDMQRFSKYAPLFRKYGKLYGFDWLLLAALAYQESGLDPGIVSPDGAVGLMQVLPSTAGDHRIRIKNIRNPEANVHAGTKYLALLRDGYFSEPELDPAIRTRFALAAYNAGPGNIIRSRKVASEKGYDPDRWFGHTEQAALRVVGSETVRHVGNVNKYYLAYSLSGALDCLRERHMRDIASAAEVARDTNRIDTDRIDTDRIDTDRIDMEALTAISMPRPSRGGMP